MLKYKQLEILSVGKQKTPYKGSSNIQKHKHTVTYRMIMMENILKRLKKGNSFYWSRKKYHK